MIRVLVNNIKLGVPLSFNCYDVSGVLLLRSGNIIANQKQLDFLIERGLFCEPHIDSVALTSRQQQAKLSIQERHAALKDKVKLLFDIVSKEFSVMVDSTVRNKFKNCQTDDDVLARLGEDNATELSNDKIKSYFLDRVIRVAKEIQSMCAEDVDAALAAIHLDNHEGYYGVFHALERAMMCELISANEITSDNERLPVICAALTADLSIYELQNKLVKQGAKLTDEQRAQINNHPIEMAGLLHEFGVRDEAWFNAILHHHERIDGKGYPFGIRGSGIKYPAKLLAIADIYSAMISARADRNKKLPKAALREIFLLRGSCVDAGISMTFVKELGIYPPGTFVRLRNAEIGVVVKRGQSAKNPLVKCVAGPLGAPIDKPFKRDTTNSDFEIMEMIPRENAIQVNFKLLWN